jgi:heavy metal sensor kinase
MLSALPIRVRLAAGFAVAMAAVLVGLGIFVYLRVGDALLSSVDQSLRAQAAESSPHARRGPLIDADARSSGIVVQVLDANGRVVRSAPAGAPALLEGETVREARAGQMLVTVSRGSGESREWRALARPVDGGVIVVARSLRQREETLHHLFRVLLIAGPLGLLLATIGGYLLAAAALRPVESMRRRAGAISAATAGARLPVPRSRDEIRRLAETLNGMLGRLEASFAHERRFVADASHELRTPLALLKTELELALHRERSSAELRSAIASAAVETDRLIRLAEDLLLIARLDQAELPLNRESVDLPDLASRAVARFSVQAETAGRRVEIDVPAGCAVEADRLRLEQAVGNLLDNALRHGDGTVTLRMRGDNGAVELHVTDEGRGFPPGFSQRAFERFSRADETRGGDGTGLGLAIVDAVARAHGGTAGLTKVEHGSDVWLRLPADGGAPGSHRAFISPP